MASIHKRQGQAQRRQQRKRRQDRRRRQAQAKRARQQLRKLEQQAPPALRRLLQTLGSAFTEPTYYRFVALLLAVLLTTGMRTVCNVLRTVEPLAAGHPSSYHRVFSRAAWSPWSLSRRLTQWLIQHFAAEGPIYLVGDDTVDEHRGKNVFGKGRHRDAVRSSHSYTAFRYGHKWVVLAVLVRFSFARRPWALPVLVALSRNKDKAGKKRHKTPSQQMRQLLKVLLRWFPERQFVFTGDGGYGTHELARTAGRRSKRLTLVSRFYADANLYQPPPVRKKHANGRPRVKGRKLPTPAKSWPANARESGSTWPGTAVADARSRS